MILCPICGAKTRVVDTRVSRAGARRRRRCSIVGCSGKATTVELVVSGRAALVLADGSALFSARQLKQLQKQLQKVVVALGGGAA